jgi:hypothetical protein
MCFTTADPWLVIPQSYRDRKLYKARLYHINNVPPSRKIHVGWGMLLFGCKITYPVSCTAISYLLNYNWYTQLCCDLGSYMRRLLDESIDPFWKTGWVYTRVRHCVAFMYNGLLFVSLCVCVCVKFIHTCMCVYVYAHARTYIYLYMYVYMN